MIRLPIIALLVSILISMTGCKFRSSPYNRPEYSKEDVLYTKYSGLLEQIDNNIDRSDSVSELASNLKKISLPNNLIYLALKKENPKGSFSDFYEKTIEIVKTFEIGDSHTITLNNTGYGTVGNKKIAIILHPLDKFKELKHCIIYLEHQD